MSSLFKKLNTLVRASINDALGDVMPSDSKRWVPPGRLGKNIDGEIASLRERINEAVAHEETLKQRIDALQAEIAELDRAADAAVESGREDEARRMIARMQGVQRRAEMAESDLREHQLVTEELIQRVNLLDAVVADARRAQAVEDEAGVQQPQAGDAPGDGETAERGPVKVLSDLLRDARQSVDRAGDTVQEETARAEADLGQPAPEPAADSQTVDDDLTARLKRLSKPD